MSKPREHIGSIILLLVGMFLLSIMIGSFIVEHRNEQLDDAQILQDQEDLIIRTASRAARRGDLADGIHLIEFGDFTCPHCQQLSTVMQQVLDEYPEGVQHIWFHAFSEENDEAFRAAVASECAKQQGKFWQYHDILFTQSSITVATLNQAAVELELDTSQFQQCLESSSVRELVLDQLEFASINQVTATPTLLVGEERREGLIRFEDVKELIEREISSN